MDTIIALRNVTKRFAKTTVLDNVNLQIREGEKLALLGPNGSGKTTLLKILAFILKPTHGDLYFNGAEVTNKNIDGMRMKSTMVFQKTVLFHATVYNNIAYGLRVRGTPKKNIDEKVSSVLNLVKLQGFEKRQAEKLSGGEKQRLALARALALNTKLLLLDEPTANLDPKNATIIEEVIASVNKEAKTTIVMATHNMFQAKNLPHRIALINEGKITEIGSPASIFGSISKTLASFAAVENIFTGTAKGANIGTSLVDIGNNVLLETATPENGSVSVFISPDDIIVSKKRLASSARNVLKGTIVEITDQDPLVKLKIDAGKPFTVQITKRSFTEMNLNLNAEVFLTFKASNVQII